MLAANTLLRPVVNGINRLPVDAQATEITHIIHIITPAPLRQAATQALEKVLEQENYPLGELEISPFSDDLVEIKATLMATSIDPRDSDRVQALLSVSPAIQQVYWETSTSE